MLCNIIIDIIIRIVFGNGVSSVSLCFSKNVDGSTSGSTIGSPDHTTRSAIKELEKKKTGKSPFWSWFLVAISVAR